MKPFTQNIQSLYQAHKQELAGSDQPQIAAKRETAANHFFQTELPTRKYETWRHHAIDELVSEKYDIQTQPSPYQPVNEYFKCELKNIIANTYTFLNGWYVHENSPLTVFDNGMIIGSLAEALKSHPALVSEYFAKQDIEKNDNLLSLNEALFTDGLFVYIPDNLSVEIPIQLISIVHCFSPLLVQQRNLIVIGKNSSLSLVQCDDSFKNCESFINNVTEVFLQQNAHLHYYKLENKDEKSLLVNQVYVNQSEYSEFVANTITFNAGFVRNSMNVNLNEPEATTKLYGLYLVDKEQYVDNQIFVRHFAPNCTSYQLYKGIADDKASANFNGHIYVAPNAQQTNAYQSSKNISLTDEAKITTQPFLEIYADDVKCSHGSTVGQLDEEALYYLRSRGICERNARRLLLFAFANEMAEFVDIESLRERLNDMIRRRLSGELTICDNCRLHCSAEHHFSFENISIKL